MVFLRVSLLVYSVQSDEQICTSSFFHRIVHTDIYRKNIDNGMTNMTWSVLWTTETSFAADPHGSRNIHRVSGLKIYFVIEAE